ncbi:MAG: hypothetical protein HF978_20095 [Desulfobacteraceae bacterium]|nr:hypothetical protein [Desulfobacteraceae bacterium]MBC2757849.1 hypothetical protein [Desulfobacteraceae bacterium]
MYDFLPEKPLRLLPETFNLTIPVHFTKALSEVIMKNKPTTKKNDAVSVPDNNLSQPPSEKSGILKRFLEWIAKGAGKTCPT